MIMNYRMNYLSVKESIVWGILGSAHPENVFHFSLSAIVENEGEKRGWVTEAFVAVCRTLDLPVMGR